MRIPAVRVSTESPLARVWTEGWRGVVPRSRLRLLRPRPLLDWAFLLTLVVYLAVCLVLYFQFVAPWIETGAGSRMGADSDYYWNDAMGTEQPLIGLTGNLLGPVLLIRTLRHGFLILCFNVLVLLLSVKVAGTIRGVRKAVLGFLLLANGEMIPALTTVNKEIFVVFAGVLTVKYLDQKRPSWLLLAAAVAASIVARWEMAAFLLLMLLLSRVLLRERPWTILLLLVGVVTVVYPFLFRILGLDPHSLDWLMEGETTARLDTIQRAFGFPLVVLPKIFLVVTGPLHKPQFFVPAYWMDGFLIDAQNFLFLPLGCLALTVLLVWAWRTGRMALHRPVALLCWITLVLTAVTPFTQPRYVFVVYVMVAVEMSRPRGDWLPDGPLARRAVTS